MSAVDGGIGYLRLDSFDPPASRGIQRVLRDLLASGIGSLVFDLRNNPGGDLQSTVNILGLFLEEGSVIIRTVDRSGEETIGTEPWAEPLSDPGRLPMVVVVDKDSASAAEVTAGALRDHERAVVVGETTYGKNTGGSYYSLENEDSTELGILHLTTSLWYTPMGTSAKGGLAPDVTMDLPSCLHPAEVTRQALAALQIVELPEFEATRQPVAAVQPVELPEFGDRLIYDSDRGAWDYEIFIVDLTTGVEQQITNNYADDGIADWSPDGTRIVYESDRGGDYEIFIVDLATGVEQQITNNFHDDKAPVWSPDGTRIVYDSDRDGDYEIFIVDLATGVEQQITDNTHDDLIADWSPDGTRIVYESDRDGDYEIFIVDLADGTEQQITHNDGDNLWPAWS